MVHRTHTHKTVKEQKARSMCTYPGVAQAFSLGVQKRSNHYQRCGSARPGKLGTWVVEELMTNQL